MGKSNIENEQLNDTMSPKPTPENTKKKEAVDDDAMDFEQPNEATTGSGSDLGALDHIAKMSQEMLDEMMDDFSQSNDASLSKAPDTTQESSPMLVDETSSSSENQAEKPELDEEKLDLAKKAMIGM